VDQTRFSTIAHTDHRFLCPLSAAKAEELIDVMELSASDRILDVGCGKGELLVRIVERYAVAAVGIDPNPSFAAKAREAARERVPGAAVQIREERAESYAPRDFRLAMAIGATHAYGGYRESLRALAKASRPGGQVLVGEGYWRRPPAAEYLAVMGADATEFTDHAGNVAAGCGEGLTPLYSRASSDDEWDHYEGLYARAMERHLAHHPDDPDHTEMRDKIRRWRDAYLRWGRETLGFGFYLFRV
jgi:SAM-dependent methyltransferase